MQAARRFFLVAAVATAIAADQAAAAAPVLRPANVAVAARELADRLVVRFHRVVPAMRPPTTCRDERSTLTTVVPPADEPIVYPVAYSPFQYRLPPPVA